MTAEPTVFLVVHGRVVAPRAAMAGGQVSETSQVLVFEDRLPAGWCRGAWSIEWDRVGSELRT